MKKLLCLLLCSVFLMGCQSMDEGEKDIYEVPADEYIWEDVGATILLPTGTMQHCYAEVTKDNGSEVIWFFMQDSGDAAFWLKAYRKDTDADTPVVEEQLGVFTLGETDTHIIQVMTSTCGTLNNEAVRPLWEELRQKAAEMTEENIVLP